ncbi:MAG TPA: DUF523 domain-containing protein [Clostridiaceae bacterium]|nr:DUF523 domain-containing protein [Clostridiaceae bacterium]
MENVLVSACLAGVNCKYNGGNNLRKDIQGIVSQGKAILVCPEQLGGCPTPRPPAEIQGGTGADVLDGKCKVINRNGEDVTYYFINGAEETLKIAKMAGIKRAILKSRSPSCGYGQIYDGSFSGKVKEGNGVTAELLLRNGIMLENEK